MVVSLTMPAETPVDWVEDFADGLAAAIGKLGAGACSVAGGDLGRGRELAVTVAVLGTLGGGQPVLRSGARAGDTVAMAGRAGSAAAGLALLESGHPVGSLTPELRSLLDLQCRPEPPLDAGPLARTSGATAMMDISDGLVRDGTRLALASNVVLDLDPRALKLLAGPAAAGRRNPERGPAGVGAWRRGGPWPARHFPRRRTAAPGLRWDRLSTGLRCT